MRTVRVQNTQNFSLGATTSSANWDSHKTFKQRGTKKWNKWPTTSQTRFPSISSSSSCLVETTMQHFSPRLIKFSRSAATTLASLVSETARYSTLTHLYWYMLKPSKRTTFQSRLNVVALTVHLLQTVAICTLGGLENSDQQVLDTYQQYSSQQLQFLRA